MWKNKNISLGEVRVGQEQVISFEYEGDITINKNGWGKPNIVTSCGCTSATFRPDKKALIVKYTPGDIPKHLANQGRTSYPSKKTVTVNYTEEGVSQKEVLTFTATVIKNLKK